MGFLGGAFTESSLIPSSPIGAFRTPDPEVPTPGQPPEPEYGPRAGLRDSTLTLRAGPATTDCRGVVVPAKLPKKPGVQLLLPMQHLQLSPQGVSSPSPQARAQDPSTA